MSTSTDQPKLKKMKPKINLLLLTILVAGLNFSVSAQTGPALASVKNNEVNSLAGDNKVTGTIVLPEKLLRNFNRTFPLAQNPKWTTTDDAFLSSFVNAGRSVNASFSKRGQFVYALIYGKETDLPEFIQQDIKKSYPSSTVFKVIEMKKPETTSYQVILQNATEYIDLQISWDGKMQEDKRVTKAEG